MPSSSPLRPSISRHSPSARQTDRSLQRAFRDHNENGGEIDTKGAERSNQTAKAQPPKRPWVTHFSKPGTTPSPKKRVLTEHNESNSPVRARSIRGNSDASVDNQRDLTPECQRREDSSPGKGVAELSKRIQQFLEDQEALLGVRNGSPYDSVEGMSQVSTEHHQNSSSSPYDPYLSPFCNRPQFLRWHGKASPMDVVGVRSDNAEELPLFDDDQNIVSLPLQCNSYPAILPPGNAPKLSESAADGGPAITEETSELIEEGKGVEEKYPAVLHSESTPVRFELTEDGNVADGEGAAEQDEEASGVGENGCLVMPTTTDEDGGDPIPMPENHKAVLREQESAKKNEEASFGCSRAHSSGGNLVELAAAIDSKKVDCDAGDSKIHSSVEGEELELDEESPWRSMLAKSVLRATFLSAFLALALLASGSPGLLPSSLTNNPVSSIWHASRQTYPALAILDRIEGLWSAEPVSERHYLPVDIRVVKLQVETLFQSLKNLSKQGRADLGNGVRRLSASLQEWWEILVQELLLLVGNPGFGESQDQGDPFDADWVHDWIEGYEFEENWGNEEASLNYHDWELLPEYDIQAANEAVLGWMPESLRKDLQGNFSRLTDSLEVNALLDNLISDLVKSTLGAAKVRSEILHRSEKHDLFSPAFQRSWIEPDDEVAVDGSPESSLSDAAKLQSIDRVADEQNQALPWLQNQKPETKILTDTTKKGFLTEVFTESQVIDDLYGLSAASSHGELTMRDTVSEDNLLLAKRDVPQGYAVSEMHLLADNGLELDTEVSGERVCDGDTVTADDVISQTDSLQGKGVLNRKLWNLGKIAVPVVITVLLLALGRYYMLSYDTSKLPASSVQFLRKSHAVQQENADDKLHQHSKSVSPVTMIEELNDRLASMLQSPELNAKRWGSSPAAEGREEEELIRSPLVGSVASPYGSFTTFKMVSKKEGQGVESKLTPVRRSNRLKNQINMSPNSVNRIAISPP